jgi:predicted lactoylglutathione lyase
MTTQIFVNLPVKDLNETVDFFTKLGFAFNTQFTDENATCMIVNNDIFVMLLVEKFFKTFTKKKLCDTTKDTEVIVALSTESREKVDKMINKVIEAGGKGWTFKKPGKYIVRTTYNGIVSNPKMEIESNTVEVRIRPPSDKTEKQQVNLIVGEEQGLFLLMEGGDHLKKGIRNLTKLAKQHHDSDLAGYADLALGINLSRNFKDFQKGNVRAAKPQQSVEHLEKTMDKNVDDWYKRQTYFTLADVYKKYDLGNPRQIMNEFVEKFSEDAKLQKSVVKAKKIIAESNSK